MALASRELGDLQLRLDANDGKLKSLQEVGPFGKKTCEIGDCKVFFFQMNPKDANIKTIILIYFQDRLGFCKSSCSMFISNKQLLHLRRKFAPS